jgi:uncharacterized membrane-anchored protein
MGKKFDYHSVIWRKWNHMQIHAFRHLAFFAVFVAILVMPVAAQGQSDLQEAWEAANKSATAGPHDIPFADQAVLKLPGDMIYIPKAEAAALMRLMGNSVDEAFQGLVMSPKDSEQWFITIDQIAEGFVKDDEARGWDAAALLQSIKDGTEAQN